MQYIYTIISLKIILDFIAQSAISLHKTALFLANLFIKNQIAGSQAPFLLASLDK